MRPTYLGLLAILLTVLTTACGKREVIKIKEVEVDISARPFKACDRGLDFNGRKCDRVVDDRTFWLGRNSFNVKQKKGQNQSIDAHIAYEFSPSPNGDSVGLFRRAIYFEDPNTQNLVGYMDSGYLSRISHNAVDFVILDSTCRQGPPAAGNLATAVTPEASLTMYYERSGDAFWFGRTKKRNAFTDMLLLPMVVIDGILNGLSALLTQRAVTDLLTEPIDLTPYKFTLDNMPVRWGCAINGKFERSGPLSAENIYKRYYK